MVAVFVLGPSKWRDPGRPWDPRLTPLDVRRAIAWVLRRMSIPAIVMEEEPGPDQEPWQDKFFRLLEEHGITDIVFYWPPKARIDAAEDELIMLAVREGLHPIRRARIALFGHVETIAESMSDGERFLEVRDEVGRSSYLGQVPHHLATDVHEWSDHDGMFFNIQDWARAMFPDVVADHPRGATPLESVLQRLRRR